MLHALDKTLESLLKKELLRELPSEFKTSDTPTALKVQFSFLPPEQVSKSVPEPGVINLFLYDVQENLDLRTSAWSVQRQSNGQAIKKRPPARVDCSYLITAWPKNEEDILTEHQLLGAVMKVLLRYRTIPLSDDEPDFRGQEFPLRLISLRPSKLHNTGEFWQAMGGKDGARPKAVLHTTVTICVPVDEEPVPVPLVGVNQALGE